MAPAAFTPSRIALIGAAGSGDDAGQAAIIAAVIAAVALLASTIATQWLQYRRDGRLVHQQLERESAERQRLRLAAQRGRLQASFSSMLLAANAYNVAATRLQVGMRPGETNKDRLQELRDLVDEAQHDVAAARVALLLDGTCTVVLLRFSELNQEYARIVMSYNDLDAPRNGEPRPDLADQTQKVLEAHERMATAMHDRLAALGVDDHPAIK